MRLLPPAARPKSRTRVAGLAFCANLLRSSFLYDPPQRCAQKLVELLLRPPGTADTVDTVHFSFQQLRMLECCASIISTLLLPARRHAYRPLLLRLKPLPDIVRWITP